MDHLAELYSLAQGSLPKAALSSGFTLENGHDQLASWFGIVKRLDYPDALEVTDPDAVLNYLLSIRSADGLADEPRQRLEARVRDHFAAFGTLHVRKSIGMFMASGRCVR
ncbi:MAG TPA: hypothetical protein VJT78_04225 [Candidatus Dormibacteraeota bacterium]|nr:hypothetical protein [Candidatus Dormibacteraeota bacterium]